MRFILYILLALFLCPSVAWSAAAEFTYDESDNTVVTIKGSSGGTEGDFDQFVTADRAGTAELTPEDAPISTALNMTLTYQIRPVEDLALQISFVIAAKTTEADYLWITGTDWDGQAQTEDIDISAGNGTYNGTNKWQTITSIDCDDTTGAGEGNACADGTLQVTQPQWGVIWDFGTKMYQIDCHVDFGDNSTTTHFVSKNESVYWTTGIGGRTRASATLIIGELSGDWGVNGSYWSVAPTGSMNLGDWATSMVEIYASQIHIRNNSYILFRFPNAYTVKNAILSSIGGSGAGFFFFNVGGDLADLQRVYINNCSYGLNLLSADTLDEIHMHNNYNAGIVFNNNDISVNTNALITHATSHINAEIYTQMSGSRIECVDLNDAITTVVNNQAANWVQESYSCKIKVFNSAGVALQFAVVDCEDTDATAIWAAGTITTDASGDIAEQKIPYKRWSGTSETLKTYSPHKFTISKAGYEPLILENITIDGPIDWHIELQPARWGEQDAADDYFYAEAVGF